MLQIPLALVGFLASWRELLLSGRCTGWAGDIYLGGEGQKCPRPLFFGHHEEPQAHTSLQAPQTHHSDRQVLPRAEDSLLWEEDAANPCHGSFQPALHQRRKGCRGYCCGASCPTGTTVLATELAGGKHSWLQGLHHCQPTGSLPSFPLPPNKTATNAIIKSHGMAVRSLSGQGNLLALGRRVLHCLPARDLRQSNCTLWKDHEQTSVYIVSCWALPHWSLQTCPPLTYRILCWGTWSLPWISCWAFRSA